MRTAWKPVCMLIAAVAAMVLVPAHAQRGGGQRGGGQGGGQGGGNAPLRNLIPPCIDLILANPADNSLIVRDPPIEDPNTLPVILVKAQWLEVTRVGSGNTVRKFRAIDSPEISLTSGLLGEIKVKTPTQTNTYPIRVKLEPGDVVSMTIFSATESGKVQYKLDRKDGVQIGDSYVVSGLISPQNDGQRESYLQITFNLKPKKAEDGGKEDAKSGGGKPAGSGDGKNGK
jgi:hypothetical protein